ncbi:aldehyde dehydrogenase family protein [Saccharopolyspora erythraea]|uniref:aldehyde dehydrogenase family protein n=1 Tax=Saccharopolyspora erythraea TaxID=1836 RepID=UPI001BAA9C95|nr:aldehyde dehydrogenase family protein [Saccharopolyspora erythraea]QUH03345.1 aldehyde dehydrogenase family protein [Saccharopolyspora erythraea]
MAFVDPEVWENKIFTGRWSTAGGAPSQVTEPATGKSLGQVGTATPADVDTACARAAAAQREWERTPFEERAAILRRAGRLFEEHAPELRTWLVREAGSIGAKADLELRTAATECYEAAALPSHPSGDLLPAADGRLSFSRRVAAGVVGVIAPFNFPLILSIRAVAPALALGNSVVLKPDTRTAVCGGAALAEVFAAAGVPEGVFQVLPGGADAGAALVANKHTRVIAFTGSTGAGRKVAEAAATHLKRTHLELGGNNALIVLPDADVAAAASAAAWGAYLHQGQICMAAGRHLVHESIADDYVAALAEKARALPVGDPHTAEVALGPIIDEGQRDNIHRLVTASAEAGARVVAGGTYEELFYRPTVLDQVRRDTPAFAEEIFGPVAPVLRYRTVEEAVEIAADSEYGLSLSVLGADAMRAWEVAKQIPSGLVHVNDQTVGDQPHIPFGGVRDSGNGGRIGGAAANVEAFTETQWVTIQGSIQQYPF